MASNLPTEIVWALCGWSVAAQVGLSVTRGVKFCRTWMMVATCAHVTLHCRDQGAYYYVRRPCQTNIKLIAKAAVRVRRHQQQEKSNNKNISTTRSSINPSISISSFFRLLFDTVLIQKLLKQKATYSFSLATFCPQRLLVCCHHYINLSNKFKS